MTQKHVGFACFIFGIAACAGMAMSVMPSSASTLPLRDRPDSIVGGVPAEEGDFPWMVKLSIGCGGSLVGSDVVLTAAHCVEGTGREVSITGVVGAVDRWDVSAPSVRSTYVYQAPGFSGVEGGHDWALIKLASPVQITPLPIVDQDDTSLNEGLLTIMGWGTTSEGGSKSRSLLKAEVPFVDDETCGKAYRDSGYPFNDHEMMCAGDLEEGGVDTCQGDSGGPIVHRDVVGEWRQVGIVSWGEGCARPGFPGVYSEVATFSAEIHTAMETLP